MSNNTTKDHENLLKYIRYYRSTHFLIFITKSKSYQEEGKNSGVYETVKVAKAFSC